MSADRNVLFMSYSHVDADMCRQLEAHLRRKASSLGYEVWWDTAVRPGREWRPQIGEMVSRAGACILLASVHSMESPFIWEQEVKPMLAAGVPVAPLYVGAFDYEAYPEVAKLAFLAPFDPDRPLNALPSGDVAHALTIVARGLDGWLPPLGGRGTSQRLPSAPDIPVAASEPTFQPGVLLGVPALPHDYQARPALAASFKDELLSAAAGSVAITAGGGDSSVGQPVGLHGGGGTGKSVMATALARDPDVRKAFPDGIMWVTVGEVRRNIAVRQQQLATWVGCDLSQCRTNRDRREALVEAFRERRCLVIVDDVWSAATAVEFDVSGGGTRVLYTTRLESLLSHPEIRAQPLRLDTLDADESLAFLAHLTGQQVPLPAEAARVAFFTNGVVLSLSLAAGAFRHGLGWSDLANRFQESSLFSEDIDSNLRAMGVAVSMLSKEEYRAYCDLVVFPRDTPIPVRTMVQYWLHLGIPDPRTLLTKFGTESNLLELSGDMVLFHDDQLFYLQANTPSQVGRHAELLNCFAPDDGWSELDSEEPYMWDHLVDHLVAASEFAEAEALAMDMKWISRRWWGFGAGAVEDDLNRLCELLPETHRAQRLRRRLAQSAHLLEGAPSHAGLANTLAVLTRDIAPSAASTLKTLAQRWWFEAATESRFESDALVKVFSGHRGTVNAIVGITVDDRPRVATGGADGTVRIWEQHVPDSESIVIEAHAQAVQRLCVVRLGDQDFLASSGDDRRIRLWNLDDLDAAPIELRGHSSSIRALASVDASERFFLASGSHDRTVRLWYRDDLKRKPLVLSRHNAEVADIAVDHDDIGLLLATAGTDGKRILWREEPSGEFEPVAIRSDASGARVAACLARTADGMFTAASNGHTVIVRDVAGRSRINPLGPFAGAVTALSVVPGGLAIGHDDGVVHRWGWSMPPNLFESYVGHTGAVTGVCALDGDRTRIASSSEDGNARVWDPARAEAPAAGTEVRASRVTALDAIEGPSSRFVAVATADRRLAFFDYQGSTPRTIVEHDAIMQVVHGLAGCGEPRLVVGDNNGQVWQVVANSPNPRLHPLAGRHVGSVLALASYRLGDRTFVASAGFDRSVTIRDLEGSNVYQFPVLHSNRIVDLCVAKTEAGLTLVTASADGTVRYWPGDSAIAAPRDAIIIGGRAVNAVCSFEHTGHSWIAAGREDGVVECWAADRPLERVRILEATGSGVASLSRLPLPEGDVVVVLTKVGRLEVREPSDASLLARIRIGERGLTAVGLTEGEIVAAHDAHWIGLRLVDVS